MALIDGKRIADKIHETIKHEVNQLINQGLRAPCLAAVLVGEDPASKVYVKNKYKACDLVGIKSLKFNLPAATTEHELLALIQQLNERPDVDGILVQLPLPKHISSDKIIEAIDPHKDVDGFHPYNFGRLAQGHPIFRPCTSYGVMELLKTLPIKLEGKNVCIVGASNIVGRPMALELLIAHATVTICHRHTQHLEDFVKSADILISGSGKPGVIQSSWIKPDAIVIDVGTTRLPDGNLIGDIDFQTAAKRASYITPVPGGVGPMTVAMLLKNTLAAYHRKNKQLL